MPSVSKSELRLLRPSTRCAEITERPSDFKTSGGGANLTGGTHHAPKAHDNVANTFLTSLGDFYEEAPKPQFDTSLSGEELLQQLKDEIRSRCPEIKQALYSFDSERSSFIALEDFRKVVENFIFPLTSAQFDQLVKKLDGVSNQKLNYNQLLFKIKKTKSRDTPILGRVTPANDSLDSIVSKLQQKLQENGPKISKAMRMFDVKLNGKIKKSDLKRVIDNFAFHISQQQFDKLYSHYERSRDRTCDYMAFLKSVIATRLPIKSPSSSPTQALVIFEEEAAEIEAEVEMQKLAAEPLWSETVPLVEVEIKLRNKIKHKVQILYRTFKSMDMKGEGYITIEQLRRALEKFAFPMTDEVFQALMERLGIKAKNKLRYEVLLNKLQDRRVGGYGQNLVIKPNHKFHPVIESHEEPNLEELLDKLKSKIVTGYSSIRQAFLVFDENKSGKISRKDFKNVIDGFCFRMSDSQYSKLMNVLDPSNKGHVTYKSFFKLFEDTESSGSHKWLNSVHRVNDHKEPKYLEDAAFKEILSKKISDDRKMVSIAFQQFDHDQTGAVSKHQLKKFLERFSTPFSKEQFEKLTCQCSVNSDGTLNFHEFMRKLGVDLRASDNGFSEQIANENVASEFERVKEHRKKLEIVAQRAVDHTKALTTDAILVQLQDYIHQRAADMRKLFNKYDEDAAGRIKRSNFKRFLFKAGFLMDDIQFKELCARMKVGKSLSYQDFLDHFQRQNNAEYSEKMQTSWSPKIVPGAPVQSMSADEGMKLLNTKLQNSYSNLRAAFHSIDRDSDGLVSRMDLVAILTNLLIPMKREDINEMWAHVSQGKKRINVQQFVSVFEETEDVNSHKWLVSVHKSNDALEPKNMAGEAVLNTFRIKALDQYFSLSKCFMSLDKDGKGKLNKKKLRQALKDFSIPISNEEFHKLWLHFDDDRTGYVDHEQFVRRAADDFNPGDNAGTSTAIVQTSQNNVTDFNTNQMIRRDDLLLNNIKALKYMSNEDLEKQLRLNMHEHYADLRTAFKAADRENLGYLRKSDLRKVLFDFNFLVDDDQFNFIIGRCGMDKKSRMSYEKFMKFFESPQIALIGIENFETLENRVAPHIASYPDLNPCDAEIKMRYCISEIKDVLMQAFGAVDLKEYGAVSIDVVKRVLDNFSFIMTEKQFNVFSKKFPQVSDGSVDYKLFLETFSVIDTEEENKSWLEAVLGKRGGSRMNSETPGRLSRRSKSCTNLLSSVKRPSTAPFVSAEHVEHQINDKVTENWMQLHKFFKGNSSGDYSLPVSLFKEGLQKVGIELSSDDMEILCKKYDVHGTGSVNFSVFLKKFSSLGRISALSGRSSRHQDRDSHMSLRSGRLSKFSYNLSRAASCTSLDSVMQPESARSVSRAISNQMDIRKSTTRLGDLTPGPGIEPPYRVISNIATHVLANWKQLRKQFKAHDTKSKGWISTNDFRNSMRSNHVDVSESDFSELVNFYESQSAGKVFYNDFLRAFLSVTTVD